MFVCIVHHTFGGVDFDLGGFLLVTLHPRLNYRVQK